MQGTVFTLARLKVHRYLSQIDRYAEAVKVIVSKEGVKAVWTSNILGESTIRN